MVFCAILPLVVAQRILVVLSGWGANCPSKLGGEKEKVGQHTFPQALIARSHCWLHPISRLLTQPQNKILLYSSLVRRLRQHAQRQIRQNGSHYHVWQLQSLSLTGDGIVALDENLQIVMVLSLERLLSGSAPARSLSRISLFPPGRNVCRLRDGSWGVGDEDNSSPLNSLPPRIPSSVLARSLSPHHSERCLSTMASA